MSRGSNLCADWPVTGFLPAGQKCPKAYLQNKSSDWYTFFCRPAFLNQLNMMEAFVLSSEIFENHRSGNLKWDLYIQTNLL
jgi:hypothetical protein